MNTLIAWRRQVSALIAGLSQPQLTSNAESFWNLLYFVVASFAKLPLLITRFVLELPLHFRASTMNGFTSSALRSEDGRYLESYHGYVRRSRSSVAAVMLAALALVAQFAFFGYSIWVIGRPTPVYAVCTPTPTQISPVGAAYCNINDTTLVHSNSFSGAGCTTQKIINQVSTNNSTYTTVTIDNSTSPIIYEATFDQLANTAVNTQLDNTITCNAVGTIYVRTKVSTTTAAATITVNGAPTDPTSLGQFKSDGTTAISPGTWTNQSTVVIKQTMADANATDTLTPRAEFRASNDPIVNTYTHSGSAVAYAGAPVVGSITITGLTNGTQYRWQAITYDNGLSGNVTPLTSNWAVYAAGGLSVGVDLTAPTAPTTVNDGTGSDATYTNSTTTLSANWTASTDASSGIQKYQDAIGTTSGGTQVLGYTDNGTATTVTNSGLSLSSGTTYYVSVRAVDNAGNTGAVTTSNGITVDTVAPTATGAVNDGTGSDATWTNSTTTLSANWTAATDALSGIQKYQYAIGTTSGGTQTLGYTDNSTSTTVTNSGLSLSNGTTYYVSVRAVDNANNTGAVTTSNGITVDTVAPTAPAAVNDGTGSDATYSTSTTTLSANWTAGSDALSGVQKYQYAIGTTSGGTQVLAYTDNSTTLTVTNSSLSLSSGTTYYVSVRTVDNATNTSSVTTSNGITVDTAAPTISSIIATTTTSGATVTWTTNEAATTQLKYGLTTAYGTTTSLDATPTTSHTVTISGLAANTLFHGAGISTDAAANTTTSTDLSFTTLATPRTLITSVQVSAINPTSVTVTWTTNEPATSKVRYGLTTAYGSEVADATLVTSHSITITNLTAGSQYHYEVISAGSTTDTDADATFTTAAATVVATPSSVTTPTITNYQNGDTTADTTPTIAGTGPAGGGLFVVVDRQLVRTVPVAADGTYIVDLLTPLTLGPHAIVVRAKDADGKVSDESTPMTITVVRPSIGTTITWRTITDGVKPTISFGAVAPANTMVKILIDTTVVKTIHTTSSTSPAFGFITTITPPSSLSVGRHTISFITLSSNGRPSVPTGATTFTKTATTSTTASPIIRYQEPTQYAVQVADSLWSIAQHFLGDGHRWPVIQGANISSHPSLQTSPQSIRAGWTLIIPAS